MKQPSPTDAATIWICAYGVAFAALLHHQAGTGSTVDLAWIDTTAKHAADVAVKTINDKAEETARATR